MTDNYHDKDASGNEAPIYAKLMAENEIMRRLIASAMVPVRDMPISHAHNQHFLRQWRINWLSEANKILGGA